MLEHTNTCLVGASPLGPEGAPTLGAGGAPWALAGPLPWALEEPLPWALEGPLLWALEGPHPWALEGPYKYEKKNMGHKYILGPMSKTKSRSGAMSPLCAQGWPEHVIGPSP